MKKTATHTHPLALCAADLVTLVHDGLMNRTEARSLLGLDPDETTTSPDPSAPPVHSLAEMVNALASAIVARKNPDTVLVEIPKEFLLEAQSILSAALHASSNPHTPTTKKTGQ